MIFYIVNIKENILDTGNVSKAFNKQDYITIVEQDDGNNKLNINNYVKKEKQNIFYNKDNLKLYVKEVNIYIDYVYYTISIQNDTKSTIILDTKQNANTIYLENYKGAKYFASMNEIIDEELIIENNYTKDIKIKFYKNYSSENIVKYMIFSNVVLENGEDIGIIQIDL